MARENQGLHIALIVFVALTLVLGVTTFMFFRKFEEATLKAKTSQEQGTADRFKAEAAEKDNTELKRMIGAAATDKMDQIREDFDKEMETYAANFQENTRDYRKVLKYLFEVIRKKDTTINELQVALQDEKTLRELVETVKQPQLDEFKKAQDAAEADLAEERKKFNEDLQTSNQAKSELAQKSDKAKKDAVAAVEQVRQDLTAEQKRAKQLSESLRARSEQVRDLTKTTFEGADGKITWVSQRNNTVWINLGEADGLVRQTTFAVYPAEATDMAKAEKKGDIEVTQVLGKHLAEARVVEDKVSDPILPGDLVHTPIWTPGEHQRFALTDGMDVDGDGTSDTELVRNLITMTGGVIVAELTDDAKRTGKMDTNTRYLILGREHDEKTDRKLDEARVKMLKEAEMLGVEKVPLAELLKRMGWKNQSRVVRYGKGANPADFRPTQPDDNVAPVSKNSVSPIFQPRKPPRSATGSAY